MSATTKPWYWSSSPDLSKRLSPFASIRGSGLDPIRLADLHFHSEPAGGLSVETSMDCKIQIGVRPGLTLHADAAHGNLLHQLLVKGVQRIQPVYLVVLLLVGGASSAGSRAD